MIREGSNVDLVSELYILKRIRVIHYGTQLNSSSPTSKSFLSSPINPKSDKFSFVEIIINMQSQLSRCIQPGFLSSFDNLAKSQSL